MCTLTFQSTPVSNMVGYPIRLTPVDWQNPAPIIESGDATVVSGLFIGFNILPPGPPSNNAFNGPPWVPPVGAGGTIPVGWVVVINADHTFSVIQAGE